LERRKNIEFSLKLGKFGSKQNRDREVLAAQMFKFKPVLAKEPIHLVAFKRTRAFSSQSASVCFNAWIKNAVADKV